jgi:hypothetical protein
MHVQLVVQFLVGDPQLDSTGQQSVRDGVLAEQDMVLVVVVKGNKIRETAAS